jgi:hypothetical protein
MSNRVLIDQTTNTVNTDQCPEIHNSVVVNNEIPSNIDVIENVTNIITVTVPGPQGPQGPNGAEANISGSNNYIPIFSGSDALVTSSIYQSGSFTAIGATSSLHPNAPETLLVNSLTESYNLISGHANIDNYVQLNIKNFSGGPSASSDIVATADIGDEESNYINMGINGSNYTAGNAIGGALDAYLYNTGENLYIGNTAQSKQIVFFNGGFDVNANAALFIHDQGTITINTDQYNQTNPPSLAIQAPRNLTTNTLIEAVGNTDQFLQLALSNQNSGSFASSDIVAYNNIDPTNQAFGFIDMGINSTNFDDPNNYPGWIGGHSYVFSDAPGMIIGSTSGSSQVNIFAGGVNPITNSKLVIRANNIHSLTGSLEVTGSITSSLFGTASWALNAITASYVPASGVVGLNLSQISTGSVTASVNIGSTMFSVISGSASSSLVLTNNGFLTNESSGAPYFRLSNNNNNVNLSPGQAAAYIEVIGKRAGTNGVLARLTTTYIGDGTTRNSRFSIGTAEGTGFGGSQFSIYKLSSGPSINQQITVIGTGVDAYSTSSVIASASYTSRANVIINGASVNNIVSFDSNGTSQALVFNTGNWGINTTVDNGFKFDISGSARVQAGLIVTGSLIAPNITGSLLGTASWAQNALTASFGGNFTASNALITNTLTAQTLVVQTITSSTDFVTGSTRFGSLLSNTHEFTGSVSITGSLTLPYLSTGSVLFAGATDNIAEDNTNFFWDNTNKRLGVGSNTFYTPADGWWGGGIQEQKIFLKSTTSAKFTSLVIAGGNGGSGGGAIQFLNYTGTPIADFGTADGSEIGFAARQNTANINFYTTPSGTSPTRRMSILASGNVLIQNGGTFSDSSERLQVTGTAKVTGKLTSTLTTTGTAFEVKDSLGNVKFEVTDNGVANYSYCFLRRPNNNADIFQVFFPYGALSPSNVNWNFGMNGNSNNFVIASWNGVVVENRMTFVNNGNVLVNSSVDTGQRLQVSGSSKFVGDMVITGSLTVTQGITGSLFGTSSWAQNALTASNVSTASLVNNFFAQGGNSFGTTALLGTNDSQSLAFETSGSVRMFISGSGDVGIGTTSPLYKLDVNGNFRAGNISISANEITNPATDGYIYIGSSARSGGTGGSNIYYGSGYYAQAAHQFYGGTATGMTSVVEIVASQASKPALKVFGSSSFAGDMVITGSGNTSGSTALIVANSNASSSLRVRNDGMVIIGSGSYSWGTSLTTGGKLTIANTSGYNGLVISNGTADNSYALSINTTTSDNVGVRFFWNDGNTSPFIQHASNIGTIIGGTLPVTLRGSTATVSSSLTVTQGITGSLFGTSSWANNAVSTSFATTASSADNFTVRGTLTAQTIVAQTITSSTDFVTGSTRFGSLLTNTHQFTGSVSITGSLSVNGGSVPLGSGATGQVTYWNGTSSQAGSSNFTWNNIDGRLDINALTTVANHRVGLAVTSAATTRAYFDSSATGANWNAGFAFTATNVEKWSMAGFGTTFDFTLFNGGLNARAITFKGDTNNVLIGTDTDGGQRLQVSGSSRFVGNMVITGSGATSGTNGLIVQNSNLVPTLIARNDGRISNGDNTFYVDPYVVGGTTMVVSNNGHNFAVGILAQSMTAIRGTPAIATVGPSSTLACGVHARQFQTTTTNPTVGLIAEGAIIGERGVGVFNQYNTSSILQVDSTTKGFLLPRMTSAQRTAILSPARGLLVYDIDSTTEGLWFYNSGSNPGWQEVLTNSGSQSVSGSITATSFTGSLFGTSSWAQNAVTASYALTAQTLLGSVVSASYAATASYATNFYVSGTLNVGNTNIEFQENTNVTTGTWRVVSSEPTASYKAAFFDYVMFSGSIARAGTVYSVWSASYAEYYENYTGDVGGSTAGVSLQAAISGSNIQLQATASNNGWTIRSLVRML